MSALLKAKDVTKIYEKAQKPSLDNVSFSVENGEFISIMGASGSGKTTLLNVLSTIDTPTSGEIRINGTDLKKLSATAAADFRKTDLGFIFQEYFLLDSLTIRENIAVPLALLKLPPEKIEKSVRDFAKRFGIASQLDKYPCELSGGQRQRASAIRAIIKQPSILSSANQELHTTILMVTHDAYAASFASRIFIFRDGHILKELCKGDSGRHEFYEAITAEIAKSDTTRTGGPQK